MTSFYVGHSNARAVALAFRDVLDCGACQTPETVGLRRAGDAALGRVSAEGPAAEAICVTAGLTSSVQK